MICQSELKDRTVKLSQGRLLGGSSALNAHVFVPPSKTVIDAWEALGNAGWNWSTLKPYYAKAYSLKSMNAALKEHLGISWMNEEETLPSGPIQTSFTGSLEDPISKAWCDTFEALGYAMVGDPFAGAATGAFSCLASIDPATKERSYAATAYYAPASNRKNLHLLPNCTVQRILIDEIECGHRAAGIQFQQDGQTVSTKARKEVVLAAGAFQSPKVLELSGIGNAKILQAHGIPVHIDNPYVGENLQDHIVCSMGFEVKDEVNTLDDLVRQDPKAIEAAMGEYMTTKTGPLTSVGVASYAYLPAMEFHVEDGSMKLKQLVDTYAPSKTNATSPAAESYFEVARSILENKDESSGSYLTIAAQSPDSAAGIVAGKFITVATMLSLPLSRGSVHIRSSDPNEAPVIDPRYLTCGLDMEVLARHVQYLETIAGLKPFQSLLKECGRRHDSNSQLKDLKAAKDYIRESAVSMWHYASTCSMLPREKGGVVDDHLIVYGTSNLRIVDSSVIPLIPRANIQSTVYAVAERAADLIKARHGLTSE